MTGQTKVDLTPFRHLYPFESHYLNINGFNYHYIDQGRGEPVVMVHGNPTWSFYFRSLAAGLSGEYRVIVPDHIGCGLSDKPREAEYGWRFRDRVADFSYFLNKLDLKEKVTLIVHDWGGAIGLAWAVRNVDMVGRLVITNTAAFYPPHGKDIPWRLRVVRNFRYLARPAVLAFNAFSLGAVYMAAMSRLPKEVKAGLTAPYNSPRNRMATLKFVQDIPLVPGDPSYDDVKALEDRLESLKGIPMLICWGMGDFVFDPAYLDEWRRRFPKAEVHAFEDAGHYLLEDKPQEVLELVRNFLNNPLEAAGTDS